MKLRQKSKRDQALDATASMAKTWSEWRLGEKVAKTASKTSKKASKKAAKSAGKTSKKPSMPAAAKRRPVKIVGMIALVGGIGAAVAKKLGGGKAEPLYTPPGPAPDMAPPASPVAVEDLAQDAPPAESTSVPSTVEPALTASTEVPEREPSPVVVEDLAGDAPADAQSAAQATDEPEAAPLTDDNPPSADLASEPDDLVSGSAADPAPDDDDDKPA